MPIETISLPLFLPATRMDRLAKALASGADAVILDLEDAVGPGEKADARQALDEALAGQVSPPVPLLVRINGKGTEWFSADLSLTQRLPIAGIVLPKAESSADCVAVVGRTGKPVIGLIETAKGLRSAEAVARASARLAFGSIDFAADLGMAHEREALLFARSEIVLAARLAGTPPPLDGVTTAVRDAEAITSDSRYAAMLGFGGKLLIHPDQVAPARIGFTPSKAECEWARRVLVAGANGAAVAVDGAMIDAPVLKRAEQILSRAAAKDVAGIPA